MRIIKNITFTFALITALNLIAFANVSLKNGNFFIGYTDVVYPGGFEPKLERVYNSKSNYYGMFGWGWGCDLEVYLEMSGDGSIVVHEYGGGAQNWFRPAHSNDSQIKALIEKIIAAAQETDTIKTATEIEIYRRKLLDDEGFRLSELNKYRGKGLIAEQSIPVGTVLFSNKFSYQYIKKIRDGYIRQFDNGRVETFNDKGSIVRVADKNGNYIIFGYDAKGRYNRVTDNLGRQMLLSFNDRGLLEKLTANDGRTTEYRYNDKNQLIYSKDVDSNIYEYDYDRRHNMTRILYTDKTTMEMTYYGVDKKEHIRTVKERDGTLTLYTYENKQPEPQVSYLGIGVKVSASDGGVISESKYEYFVKRKENGAEWTQRMITTLDGDKTDTEYTEIGLPLVIRRNGEETRFTYDPKGHVTRKETPWEITEMQYNDVVGKVSYVSKTSKSDANRKSWSKFSYSPEGNLLYAENSDGMKITLLYDEIGRISSMKTNENKAIEFEYNKNSKPIVIRLKIDDKPFGEITVKYTASGEIEKVDSTAGRKIALEVTSAFQHLLDIIRPAGVNLSF